MWSPEDLRYLEKIAKFAPKLGDVKSFTINTPRNPSNPIAYSIKISYETYRETVKTSQHPITLIVNNTASATAKSSVSVSQEIQNIIRDLEKSNLDPKRLPEAKSNLSTLESELDKPNPSEKVIKKVMRWASDFGLELFLRLAVLVAERFLKPM